MLIVEEILFQILEQRVQMYWGRNVPGVVAEEGGSHPKGTDTLLALYRQRGRATVVFFIECLKCLPVCSHLPLFLPFLYSTDVFLSLSHEHSTQCACPQSHSSISKAAKGTASPPLLCQSPCSSTPASAQPKLPLYTGSSISPAPPPQYPIFCWLPHSQCSFLDNRLVLWCHCFPNKLKYSWIFSLPTLSPASTLCRFS